MGQTSLIDRYVRWVSLAAYHYFKIHNKIVVDRNGPHLRSAFLKNLVPDTVGVADNPLARTLTDRLT